VAEDVPILTTPDAKAVIERVATARQTMRPDALSRKPRKPRIETVVGRRVLDDGTHRAEIYKPMTQASRARPRGRAQDSTFRCFAASSS
jgi:hypothetical protein